MRKITAVILIAMLFLCGCAQKAQQPETQQTETQPPANAVYNPQQKDYMEIYAVRPDTLNPILTAYSANRDMLCLVFDSLVSCGDNYDLKMNLAQDFEIQDGGKKLIVNLKQNVSWHDGSTLSAADVKYTVDYILSLDGKSAYSQCLDNLQQLRTLSSSKCEFTLKQPDAGFVYLLDFPVIKNNSVKKGKDAAKDDFNACGTGMYTLENYTLNKNITLKANRSWWGGNVNIGDITVGLVPDYDSFYSGFKMDNIDVAKAQYETSGKFRLSGSISQVSAASGKYVYLAVNHSDALLADKTLRSVMNKIVFESNITGELLPGYSQKCLSPIAACRDGEGYSESSEQLKNALEENGCTAGSGSRVKKIGKKSYPLVFSLLVNSDSPVGKMVGEYISDAFVEYGIMINISYATAETFKTKAYSKKYDLVLCETAISKNRDMKYLLHSGGNLNIGGYKSDAMDELIWKSNTATSMDERNAALDETEKLFADETPHIPLFFFNDALLYDSTHVENVTAGSMGRVYDSVCSWQMKH